MAKANDTWKVLPHGPLTQVTENLYTVNGELGMPLGTITRRMNVVVLREGRLAIFSPMALDEAQMRALEALGRPAYLIVPNGMHRLDIKVWQRRYPDAQVLAPPGSRAKVDEVLDRPVVDSPIDDDRVQLLVVPGMGESEYALLLHGDSGKTLLVNDLVFNLRDNGWRSLGLRMLGFAPGRPALPKLLFKMVVKDRAAVRAQLEAWSQLDGLERLLMSHGEPIEQPRPVLRALAASID